MKRKIIFSFLVIIALFTITGCGNEKQKKDTNKDNQNNVTESNSNKTNSKENDNQEITGNYIYMVETNKKIRIGNSPSKYGIVYSTPEEAMKVLGQNIVIRQTIEDEIIKESYVGFKYNNKMYYLKGSDTSVYEENKKFLKDLFGVKNCTDTSSAYSCNNDEIGVITRTDGSTEVRADNMYCISYDNFSKCGTNG